MNMDDLVAELPDGEAVTTWAWEAAKWDDVTTAKLLTLTAFGMVHWSGGVMVLSDETARVATVSTKEVVSRLGG